MNYRNSIGTAAAVAALVMTSMAAQAFDDAKYPDLSGQWVAVRLGVRGQPAFDPTKPWGLGQQAPLTPEYQKVLEASVAEQAKGNQGNWLSGVSCLPTGMPAMMTLYRPMEIVVLPEVTYVLIDHTHQSHRRIFTDGRDWPKDFLPSFRGYSLGKWIDTDGDGKYDVLEIETRGLLSPRVFDASGLPLHKDGQSVIKERIFVDKSDKNIIYDQITVVDNALTRPWTITKKAQRIALERPVWRTAVCAENNTRIKIEDENYFLSSTGKLMPTRKDQPPPDLRYFNRN